MNNQKISWLPDFRSPATPPPPLEADDSAGLEHVRRIILRHGWNSTSYQIINPGIEHWFSKTGEAAPSSAATAAAVVGFVSCGKRRIVAGAPICAEERLPEIAAEFEDEARRKGERVCYFCAEARLEAVYSDSPAHARVLLGAQPVWDPARWAEIIARHKSLRAQLNRARNKGVTVSEWSVDAAREHPALRKCLDEWLSMKGLPPMHFLVEPDTLSRLFDRRVFVAEKGGGGGGEVVGFVVLSPVATRNGWLFEQFPHRPGAPNGTVELMIDRAMRALAADGCDYATLGLSPLSRHAPATMMMPPFQNPLWLRLVLAWMRKHGQRFYNFDGLDRFKAKLQPVRWEPVFAISDERRLSPLTLYAVASAFSGNAPARLILSGLWRALKTEMKWLSRRFNRKPRAARFARKF